MSMELIDSKRLAKMDDEIERLRKHRRILLEALKALWCDIVEYNVINHMPDANNNRAMLQAVAAMAEVEGPQVSRLRSDPLAE